MALPCHFGLSSDHITVTDLALAQIPDAYRHGQPILIRADGAGATKAWLAHLHGLRRPIDRAGTASRSTTRSGSR